MARILLPDSRSLDPAYRPFPWISGKISGKRKNIWKEEKWQEKERKSEQDDRSKGK